MAHAPNNTYTAENLYDLPHDGLRYELARGRLVSEPSPGGGHGRVAAVFVQLLSNYVDTHQSGVVLTCDPGFILARNPDTVRAPDVAYVELNKYRALGDDRGLLPIAPDLAVEILSPSHRPKMVAAKVRDYIDAGTRLVWLADPRRREVTVHMPGTAPIAISSCMTLTAPRLLPGFRVRAQDIFRSPFD